jgi:hypothetical protein
LKIARTEASAGNANETTKHPPAIHSSISL